MAVADEDNTEGILDHNDNITEIISGLQEAWQDSTDDSNLEEVRDVPASPLHTHLDNSMICDIQRIVQRQLLFFEMPDKMSGQVNVSLTLSSHGNFLIHVTSYSYLQSLITQCAITMLRMAWSMTLLVF